MEEIFSISDFGIQHLKEVRISDKIKDETFLPLLPAGGLQLIGVLAFFFSFGKNERFILLKSNKTTI